MRYSRDRRVSDVRVMVVSGERDLFRARVLNKYLSFAY